MEFFQKFLKQNSEALKTKNIIYICIEDDEIPSGKDLIESAKYIVDNLLPYDIYAMTFYFVSFSSGTMNNMIVQKTDNSKGYASFILFGYSIGNIIYRTKKDGVWSLPI